MKKILSLKTKKENRYFLSCFLACVLALGLCQNSYANGSDAFSISAPSILGTSDVGNLSTATNEGQSFFYSETCTDGGTAMPDDQAFDACPANNGYNSVDFSDIWYQVDLPDGTDEMVLSVTGLGAGEYVAYILHTGAPTASNVVVIPGTYGPCSFFDETNTSQSITGLAAASTAPIYIRIMAANPAANAACGSITKPSSFTISAFVPAENDVCSDGLNILSFDDNAANDPDSYLPLTQSGDMTNANTDANPHDGINGETCDGVTFATAEKDLWYAIKTPTGANYTLEVDMDFTGIADELYVVLHNSCGGIVDTDPIACASVSADDLISFSPLLSPNTNYNLRIVLPTGSTATTFDIFAKLTAENDNCDIMQADTPGYDVDAGNNEMNFNLATASAAVPTNAGNDLWFQFDPEIGTISIGGIPTIQTASTTAEVVIGGLDAGEAITLFLYKGETTNADNCTNLATTLLETLEVTADATVELSCLDELYFGRYILRVVQTSGSTTIDEGLIQVDPQPRGPYNNDCENVWNEAAAEPQNIGFGTDPYQTPYLLTPGYSNYVRSDFENSTDCHPDISSATCSGTDHAAAAVNEDRDVWFVFQATNTCMNFLNNAGAADKDAILYVYSACDDANFMDCSGVLDGFPSGAGDDQFNDPESTWAMNGLTIGNFYLLRVKPLDNSAPTLGNEFSIDISMESCPVIPTLSFSAATSTLAEDGTTQVCVEIQNVDGTAVTADVIFDAVDDGTADLTTDYTLDQTLPYTVSFPANAANGDQMCFTVTGVTDAIADDNETINFDLSNPTGTAILGGTTEHTTTITDVSVPNAIDDSVQTTANTAINIANLANDIFGPDGASSTDITITVNGTNGTAVVNDGGTPNNPTDDTIDYTPATDFVGTDTVTYQICDSTGDCDTAVITINIVNACGSSIGSFGGN